MYYEIAVVTKVRTPVFSLGEILILGADGREVGGPGRKPGKWTVMVEGFAQDMQAAIRRSLEVRG